MWSQLEERVFGLEGAQSSVQVDSFQMEVAEEQVLLPSVKGRHSCVNLCPQVPDWGEDEYVDPLFPLN